MTEDQFIDFIKNKLNIKLFFYQELMIRKYYEKKGNDNNMKENKTYMEELSNGTQIKIEPNPCGRIICDEIWNPIQLLDEIGEEYDKDVITEDISLDEFETAFPHIWTYCLSDMDECLFNNSKAVIVRFFDQLAEGGFIHRVCQVEEYDDDNEE